MKEANKAAKRQMKLEKLQAFEASVRIDERRRFEDAARGWAAEMENEHINAQKVLAKAHAARRQMEKAYPDAKPLGKAIAELLGGESK